MATTVPVSEFDQAGNTLRVQPVVVGNPVQFQADGDGVVSMIVPPGPLNQSGPPSLEFLPGTVAIGIGSGGCVAEIGRSPAGNRNGIPIIEPTTLPASAGQKVAFF